MRHALFSVLGIAMLVPDAVADKRKLAPDAKAELDHGLKAFQAHRYAEAIIAFDQGYTIDPDPDFLYAKAQAQRLGGDCRAAIASYNRFLSSAPPDDEAALARGNIARCEHVFAASNEPEPPALPTQPIVVERPVEPPAWYTDRAGLVLAGSAVIAAGVALGFVLETNANATDGAAAPTLPEWEDKRDAWQRDRVIAGVAAGTAGALAIGAGIRFWWSARHADVQITTGGSARSALVIGGRW
jgi:hypothetical protein